MNHLTVKLQSDEYVRLSLNKKECKHNTIWPDSMLTSCSSAISLYLIKYTLPLNKHPVHKRSHVCLTCPEMRIQSSSTHRCTNTAKKT